MANRGITTRMFEVGSEEPHPEGRDWYAEVDWGEEHAANYFRTERAAKNWIEIEREAHR